MTKFITKTLIIVIISTILFFIVIINANGYTDPQYLRFTSPIQANLILGTSKAAQGIRPEIIKEDLGIDIYNYAFTLEHSPYGPVYLESIKNKLNTEMKGERVFIVTVDPWSISSITDNPNDVNNFREKDLCLGNTLDVNTNPNFDYIFNNLQGQYATVITNYNRIRYLHDDGWFEVSVKMDSTSVKQRIKEKVKMYNGYFQTYRYSDVRYGYLIKTIEYLKEYGDVYLVRLPIHSSILSIEDKLMPDFNDKMNGIVPMSNGYFDMTPINEKFQYTDGNHLHKESSLMVTEDIVNWIKEIKEIKHIN